MHKMEQAKHMTHVLVFMYIIHVFHEFYSPNIHCGKYEIETLWKYFVMQTNIVRT